MTLSCDDYQRVASLDEGTLAEVPYATLLYSLARARVTGKLAIARPPIQKEISFEHGAPVEVRSNLVTETLSRFMVKIDLIDQPTCDTCFQESCSRGVRFGDILIEKGIITAEKLLKVLQQNLAHKLLDGFSWKEGHFTINSGEAESDSSLKVNVAQLIIIGVTRFASQEQIDTSIGPLIGKKLTIHPEPFFGIDDITFSKIHRPVIDALLQKSVRIDELAADQGIPYEDLARLLHALTLIGLITDSEAASAPDRPQAPQRQAMVPGERVSIETPEASAESRDEIMQLVLNHRRMVPAELLGIEQGASPAAIADAYLRFAERCAPWKEDAGLSENTRELFLAGARAYAELQGPRQSQPVVETGMSAPTVIKPSRPTIASPKKAAETFRLSTDLLDPEVQYHKGRKLMAAGQYQPALGQLEYAFDLDPQNMNYRAELTFCRFMESPATGSQQALNDLKEVLRIDPRCGIAIFYTGEVLRTIGKLDQAEHLLKQSIKPMAPDRRPIEALRELTAARKAKK
ncbi:MAG: DUF4388 domain-containing protein [bacterium]|nr:DUF4388 domain-containing protein [bacterium]